MLLSGAAISCAGTWVASPIVGLTGGIGCGKSTVEQLFAGLGIPCVDTDHIARSLTVAGGAAMPLLEAGFGSQVLMADGALDRVAMRRLVFADANARAKLEGILHPLILSESKRQLAGLQAPFVLLAVPLLFETPAYRALVDRTLVVDCDPALQRERVMHRSGLSADEVDAIVAAQMSRAERLALADDVIENNDDVAALSLLVTEKYRYYQQYFSAMAMALPVNPIGPACD